jgi:hypothetical protein
LGAAAHRDFMPQDEELDILGAGYSRRSDTAAIMPNRRRLPTTGCF